MRILTVWAMCAGQWPMKAGSHLRSSTFGCCFKELRDMKLSHLANAFCKRLSFQLQHLASPPETWLAVLLLTRRKASLRVGHLGTAPQLVSNAISEALTMYNSWGSTLYSFSENGIRLLWHVNDFQQVHILQLLATNSYEIKWSQDKNHCKWFPHTAPLLCTEHQIHNTGS